MAKLITKQGRERAKKLAESLELEGSRLLEASKSGKSEAAAKRLLECNIQREKAGLIKGKLKL